MGNDVSRMDAIAEARSWLGTSFHHQASVKGVGCDCIGLIKGYLWSDDTSASPKYNSSQDVGANGMLERCKEKGGINTIPEIPGVLVFMTNHVGVYIGGGYVIEAKGHAYGVVKTKLSGRGWTSWGKCPWIIYPAEIKSEMKDYEMKTYKNTSGKTLNIYADSSLAIKIGSLPAENCCTCIDEIDGRAVLRYKVVATGDYKVGFTDYVKGVQSS